MTIPINDEAESDKNTIVTNNKVVAVTGASGFIGSHVCQCLVHHGYTVRACVRVDIPSKTDHLRAMNNVPVDHHHHRHPDDSDNSSIGHLEVHVADMAQRGAYDSIFDGCTVVFHVAGNFGTDPFWRDTSKHISTISSNGHSHPNDDDDDTTGKGICSSSLPPGRPPPIESALKIIKSTTSSEVDDSDGANDETPSYDHAVYNSYIIPLRYLLESVTKCKSVRRIIYTSSGAAGGTILSKEREESSDSDFDLNAEILDNAYGRGKMDCERMLYDYGMGHRSTRKTDDDDVPLGCIVCASSCPSIVLGPLLSSPLHDSQYQHRLGDMIMGRYVLHDHEWNIIDVRDVAETQRLMAEDPHLTNGTRYWNGHEPAWPVSKVLEFVTRSFPDHSRVPITAIKDNNMIPKNTIDDDDDGNEEKQSGSEKDEESAINSDDRDDDSDSAESNSSSSSFGVSEWVSNGTTTWSDPIKSLGLRQRDPRTTVLDTVQSLLDHHVLERTLTTKELYDYYTVAEMDGCEEEMEYILTELRKRQSNEPRKTHDRHIS